MDSLVEDTRLIREPQSWWLILLCHGGKEGGHLVASLSMLTRNDGRKGLEQSV